MQIQKIDAVGAQAAQTQVHLLLDCLWPPVNDAPAIQTVHSGLRCQDQLRAMRGQNIAQKLFVLREAVQGRRVEQGDAKVQGVQQKLRTLFSRGWGSIRMTQVHAPEPDPGDLEWADGSRRYFQLRYPLRTKAASMLPVPEPACKSEGFQRRICLRRASGATYCLAFDIMLQVVTCYGMSRPAAPLAPHRKED